VRPAEGRAGLNRCVGGRGNALGLVVITVDGHVRDNGLVDSFRCCTCARSLSSDGGTVYSRGRRQDQNGRSRRRGGRRQNQSRGRIDGLTARCHSLVACREVCHRQPGAEECCLAVRHHGSRARHK